MRDPNNPLYVVHFKGQGYGAPDAFNPGGIKVTAKGHVAAPGIKPKSSFDIPFAIIVKCKRVFMEQTGCEKYAGDKPGEAHFPTVWLGKQL